MSGHSKFSNIKHKKERSDAVKGKIFTKIGREIAVAVKSGGPDPNTNMTLKNVIAKAKSGNMPNDTIERSIKKASGDLNAVNFENITYEGYGPNGVAVIVEALTDNKNRTAANIRNAFTKGGGNMGATGCVSFMFSRKGMLYAEREDNTRFTDDDFMLLALDAGAEDFSVSDEGFEIITDPDDFSAVNDTLIKNGANLISAEVTMVPSTYAELSDEEDIKKMNKLLNLLDDEDDVVNVYHNWEQ